MQVRNQLPLKNYLYKAIDDVQVLYHPLSEITCRSVRVSGVLVEEMFLKIKKNTIRFVSWDEIKDDRVKMLKK